MMVHVKKKMDALSRVYCLQSRGCFQGQQDYSAGSERTFRLAGGCAGGQM